jgi:hypothetical protein
MVNSAEVKRTESTQAEAARVASSMGGGSIFSELIALVIWVITKSHSCAI